MGRIFGNRIVLREYRSEDLSAIRAWVNDPETTRYLGNTYRKPETWEQTERKLEMRLNGDAGGEGFVIADKETMKYLGQCDLMMIDMPARRAELAIVLAPEGRGKGLGLEAVRLLTGYAFQTLNLNRVWLKCAMENTAALKCYERAGFRVEGVLREDLFIDGRYQDACIMGLLRRDSGL